MPLKRFFFAIIARLMVRGARPSARRYARADRLDRLKRSCPLSPTVATAGNRRESLDAPSEHARQPHTGAEHLRLNASVSGALRGTEGSNLASSSGESTANLAVAHGSERRWLNGNRNEPCAAAREPLASVC